MLRGWAFDRAHYWRFVGGMDCVWQTTDGSVSTLPGALCGPNHTRDRAPRGLPPAVRLPLLAETILCRALITQVDMPSRYSSSRKEIVVVVLMIAFSVMSYFDRTIMSIAGPQIMKEFDLSVTQMGSVYSAFVLSYAIMMIPGGQVVDRLGPRITLLVMGLSAALFTGLTALGGKPGLGS